MTPFIPLGSRLIPYSWAQALNASEAQTSIKCLLSIHSQDGGHKGKQEVTVRGEQMELGAGICRWSERGGRSTETEVERRRGQRRRRASERVSRRKWVGQGLGA